jgi:hypothetical protein
MSVISQQWAALESQHERLVDASAPQLHAETPAGGRKIWRRRLAGAATSAEAQAPAARHARRRVVRPEG